MYKRGQVTIFIIIAVFIVAAVALFFIFRGRLGILTPNSDPVYLFVRDCIEESGQDGIYYIIQNGGYLYPIILSTSEGLPYYFYNNQSYVPTKERVEEEISAYIEQTLSYCTDDFADFSSLNITTGEMEVKTIIKDEEVLFNVNYPIVVYKDTDVTRFADFNDIRVIARVGILYSVIEKIISEQVGQSEICLSCISNLADAEGVTIGMTNTEEGLIFALRDEHSVIKEAPIEWNFANQY